MNTRTLFVLAGVGGLVWWMFFRTPPTTPTTGGPAQTTGAPQPQGVQAYPRAIADVYDLRAFPMGTFQ